jgi:hypothetical protein
MIWPAESFPSKLGAVCSDVDTLPSLSMTCGSILFVGSRKCTSQPAWPGGDPIAKIVLPPALSRALRIPRERRTRQPVHGVAFPIAPSPTANRVTEN